MDINDLKPAAEPVWFTLVDTRGYDMKSGGKPVRLRLHGPDSPVMMAVEHKKTERQIRMFARNQQAETTPEQLEADITEHAIAAIADWEWEDLTCDGKPAKFSPENARTLVEGVRWVRDWIEEKVRSRGNFGRPKADAS